MSRVTNAFAFTQTAQIKPELNWPGDWVKWNRRLNDFQAIWLVVQPVERVESPNNVRMKTK